MTVTPWELVCVRCQERTGIDVEPAQWAEHVATRRGYRVLKPRSERDRGVVAGLCSPCEAAWSAEGKDLEGMLEALFLVTGHLEVLSPAHRKRVLEQVGEMCAAADERKPRLEVVADDDDDGGRTT